MEDGNDDPAEHILKMIGISKYPFLEANVSFHMEASYYNKDVDCYEPLIEPWSLNVYARQKLVKSSMDVEIRSNELFNINVSYGVIIALKMIQDKMAMKPEDWLE
jgi:hypothetical protein